MSIENNSGVGSRNSFETRTSCPLCHEELVIKWHGDEIPYFGEVMYISTICSNCSFRFTDTMILTQKEPVRFEMMVEGLEDLNARVIRSTSGTIRIPDLGIDVEPGSVSESYVTNIEGILERVRSVVVTATEWVKDEPEAYERGLELQKMLEEAIQGELPLKVIIEDPLGNSAIISEKAISRTLSEEEAANLHSGMVVFDVDSSELEVDSSDKIQPIGNEYK
ncbi:ZPR1 zinc finger domain-containing protein [Methanococcoides sp. NM1]|uniref:ZPR1 zinc finger domain-containing protein n=1 Tax=Methanococcoides sp. NM1 TaxID=1201013 RepID=UPI0010834060|nr:ZPR1 zinc finger domain-containing protein [Methanococcoides sp. NM1]